MWGFESLLPCQIHWERKPRTMASKAERLKAQAMSGATPESGSGALWDRVRQRPLEWLEFLHDVRVELRQVTWPSREDVISTTAVVIIAVAFFALYFFGVDSTVGFLLQRLLKLFGH
jgi:preprotein translocase subunit SecE